MAGSITSRATHPVVGLPQYVGQLSSETLAGALVMDWSYGRYVWLDPDGSTRVITLPDASAGGYNGCVLMIKNTAGGAEDLTVNDTSGAINTVSQSEWCEYIVFNDAWISLSGVMTYA